MNEPADCSERQAFLVGQRRGARAAVVGEME